MATTRACLGVITATGSTVTNLTNWAMNREAEEIDTSVMGTCAKTSTPGAVKTTINVNGFWESATGQNALETALATGSTVGYVISPGGTASGTTKFSGSANVINSNVEGPGVDNLVTFAATLVANALPTKGTN